MSKRVLDIGNCSPDHQAIRGLLQQHFDANVTQAHDWNDAAERLRQDAFDLVLVNRVLDRDGGDGMEIVRQIKADDRLRDLPVMLITNFPEHQERAVQAGALPGFGKRALSDPQTVEQLRPLLG